MTLEDKTMKPRFLLACDTLPTNPWERDRLPAIRKAFRQRPFDIFDIYEFNSRKEAHQIHRQKGELYFDENDLDELNKKFFERVSSYGCNILILGTIDNYARYLYPETIARLQKDGIFVVGILGDDEFNWKRNQLYIPMFDKVVAYVQKCVDYYNTINDDCCLYLPNSCYFSEPDFNRLQIGEEKKQHDVTLLGAPFGIRPVLVEALINADIKVSLFGSPKWKEFDKFKDFYHGYVPSDQFDLVVRASKIILTPLEDHLTGALHMNTKIWEAVRNGQMCITTRYKPLIENYEFIENTEIVMYDSVEDLVDKVRHYLSNQDDRIRIAKNLFQRVKADFDYVDLYNKLFQKLEQAYTHKRQTSNLSIMSTNPLISIVDHSRAGELHEGFLVVRLSRSRGSLQNFREKYDELIKTPYVILTYGGFEYSSHLNLLVNLFPDEFDDGMVDLLTVKSTPQDLVSNISDMNAVLWEKDAFYSQFLSRRVPVRYSYRKNLHFSFQNLRLCRSITKRRIFGTLTFLLRWKSQLVWYIKRVRETGLRLLPGRIWKAMAG